MPPGFFQVSSDPSLEYIFNYLTTKTVELLLAIFLSLFAMSADLRLCCFCLWFCSWNEIVIKVVSAHTPPVL